MSNFSYNFMYSKCLLWQNYSNFEFIFCVEANDSSKNLLNFRSQLAPNRMTEYELLGRESPGSTVSVMATIMFISNLKFQSKWIIRQALAHTTFRMWNDTVSSCFNEIFDIQASVRLIWFQRIIVLGFFIHNIQ